MVDVDKALNAGLDTGRRMLERGFAIAPMLSAFRGNTPTVAVTARPFEPEEFQQVVIYMSACVVLTAADACAWLGDTYVRTLTADELLDYDITPSEDPCATEMISVSVCNGDDVVDARQPYHRQDDGSIVFDEPVTIPREPPLGFIADNMVKTLQFARSPAHRRSIESFFGSAVSWSQELTRQHYRVVLLDSGP